MSNFTLPLLLATSLFISACGGGGTSIPPKGTDNPGAGNLFKYPDFFKEYNLFKSIAEQKKTITSLPIAQGDLVVFQNALAQAVITDLAIRAKLTLIDNFPSFSRANCEKGALSISNYSDAPPSGIFEMSNFSGVGINSSGDENCDTGYYDGYINYSIGSQITTATFGKYNSSIGTPFFLGSGGQFNASTGVLGSLKLNKPNQQSVVFTTGANKSLETFIVQTNILLNDYTKSPYTKFNAVKFKNAMLSNVVNINNGSTTFNASYTREWDEEGETFILFTRITNIVSNTNTGDISSGQVSYELTVEGNSSKYINADINYDSGVKVSYTKEGITSKNY